jgi:hypothetical protein
MLKDDLPPSGVAHTQLGIAQTWPTTLRLYRPSTMTVSVPSPPVSPLTGLAVPWTLSVGSTRGSEAFAKSAGVNFSGTISTVAGEQLVPLPQYTAGATASSTSGGTTRYWFATAQQKAVPQSYPSDLTQSFSLAGNWLTSSQVTALTIKVQTSSGALVGGARVAISGGPGTGTAPGVYLAGVTGTSGGGTGLFTIFVPSGSNYTLTAWGPTTSAQLTSQSITSTVTKTITVS